ncbi:MAG TPA: cytochrome c3 family protein [Polyangiaceae bacterium]
MNGWPWRVAAVLGLVFLCFAQRSRAQSKTAPGAPRAAAATSGPGSRTFTDEMPCSACHTTAGWRAKGGTSDGKKFDHSTTGFPLTGEHVHAPCVGCHEAGRTIERACVSCHEDFHRGRLSQSCDRCHSSAGWKLTRPIELHRFTRFPLSGMHVLSDCSECHRRASEERFTDAPVACFGCHEKDYRRAGIFPVHAGTATTAPLPRDCSLCHRAVAWVPAMGVTSLATAGVKSPLKTAPPNHDLRFPISFGSHRTATCPDCHVSQAAPRAVRCIGCHAHDPARLMAQHREPVAADGAACLGCHLGGARR